MRMVTGLRRSDFLKLLVKILGSGAARGIAFSSFSAPVRPGESPFLHGDLSSPTLSSGNAQGVREGCARGARGVLRGRYFAIRVP